MVDALRVGGPASRAEIAERTGMSRSTVSSLLGEMHSAGLICEREEPGRPAGSLGRPATHIALAPGAGVAFAFDFGHRHLRLALADLTGRVLAERAIELDVDASAERALDLATELGLEALDVAGADASMLLGAALGLPSPVDASGGRVSGESILSGWAGVDPQQELSRRFGRELAVVVENDANLAALGEMRFGAGVGVADLIHVIAASGIGAGIVLDGSLHRGHAGAAGELGHVVHDPAGVICRCGNRGCLETIAGAEAMLRMLRPQHGESLDRHQLVPLASRGDLGCIRALEDAGRAIGRTLADACNLIAPARIIVGGDLGGPDSPLLGGIRESLERFALPSIRSHVEVVGGELGARAEMMGGLSLVIGDVERLSSELLVAVS